MDEETGATIFRNPEGDDSTVILGKGLTVRNSTVSTRESMDKVRGRAHSRAEETLKDFVYPVSALGAVQDFPINLTIHSLRNLKHLVDGSHSNIFKGGFGDADVIVKTIRQRSMSNKVALQEYKIETELLSRMSHTNVVKMLGMGKFVARNGRERPFLVLEKLEGGTLQYLLSRKNFNTLIGRPYLSTKRCVEIIYQLVRAVQYLHEDFHSDAVLIHRDLKPDNIAFTTTGTLKVIDFGLCTSVPRVFGKTCSTYKMTGNTGSLRYMAPEVARNEEYSEKVDIYSIAIILWQMLTGKLPYASMTREDHQRRVCVERERPFVHDSTDSTLKEILAQSWSPTDELRPKASELAARLGAFMNASPPEGCLSRLSCCVNGKPEERASLMNGSPVESDAEDCKTK